MPKTGRPPGAVSPQQILLREMKDTAALALFTRELLEKQLKAIEKLMDLESTTPEQIVQLGGLLPEVLEKLTRNLDVTSKLLMKDQAPVEDSNESVTADQVMAELKGSKR